MGREAGTSSLKIIENRNMSTCDECLCPEVQVVPAEGKSGLRSSITLQKMGVPRERWLLKDPACVLEFPLVQVQVLQVQTGGVPQVGSLQP